MASATPFPWGSPRNYRNVCYPLAFGKIARTVTGSAEELVVEGTITEERENSGEENRPRGAGLLSEVNVEDGQSGRVLMQIDGELQKVPVAPPLGKNLLIVAPFLAITAITSLQMRKI